MTTAIPSFLRNRTSSAAVLSTALFLGLGFSATSVSAQSVATVPVGAVTIPISGAVSGSVKYTTFSPVLRIPTSSTFTGKVRGTLTEVSATTVMDSSAAWGAGELSQASVPYFIHIRSGTAVGSWWQVSTSSLNTSSQLNVISVNGVTPVTAGLSVGDSYEIIPVDTLQTFFAGLESSIGGDSAANADSVRLHDGASWREFYFNTTAGQWREGSSSFNRNTIIIRPNSGVVFGRRGVTNLSIVITGSVSDSNEKFSVPSSGISFVGGTFPVDRTLGSLNVNSMQGFVANTGDLAAADKVRIYDAASSSYRVFNYLASASQWREGSSTFNRNTYSIPAGTPFIIERGSGATGTSVSLTQSLPYSL